MQAVASGPSANSLAPHNSNKSKAESKVMDPMKGLLPETLNLLFFLEMLPNLTSISHNFCLYFKFPVSAIYYFPSYEQISSKKQSTQPSLVPDGYDSSTVTSLTHGIQ